MAESIGEMFAMSGKTFAQKTLIKYSTGKNLTEISYHDFFNLVKDFGTGLISLGVMPSDKIFVLSDNRKEWLAVDLSLLSIGAINISRGNDSTSSETEYIINHCSPKVIIVENALQLKKIASLKDQIPKADKIIIIEDHEKQKGETDIFSYDEIITLGKKQLNKGDDSFENRLQQIRKTDLATIVYTSGTTGPPKGVMLTHGNILDNIESSIQAIDIDATDRFLSILPSWHMFERMLEYVVLHQGASMLYTTPRTLGRDMILEKPTYLVSVPRIWETFYGRISKTFKEQKPFIRKVISILLSLGRKYTLAGRVIHKTEIVFVKENPVTWFLKIVRALLWRMLLKPAYWAGELLAYRKVRNVTGGFLKAGVSGGGSLPSHLDDFFETVGIEIINGYGLTETSPVLTARIRSHNVRGTIGRPVPNTEIKVVDEEGSDLPVGEQGVIMARGPQVMKGYFRDEAATSKVLGKDGWLDTGDLGKITMSGDLVITGRAKDTIVLLGGENVEPEPIETALKESEYIDNVMVVGQDRKYLTALINLDQETISEYFVKRGVHCEDSRKKSLVEKLIKQEITSRINQAKGFKPLEKIVKFELFEENWSRESGLLTPTLKLKRNVMAERYQDMIRKIYE